MISLQGIKPEQYERWPMAPDIIESSEALAILEHEDEEAYEFLFEPREFCEAHGDLKLEDYKMSEIQLHD